jgi:hypothetical protein
MNHTIRDWFFRTALWLFACVLPMVLRAAPPNIQVVPASVAEYRVVGVTTTTTDGSIEAQDQFGQHLAGFAAMDRLCQVEVDLNARAATAREWQMPHQFQLPEGFIRAWLDPGRIEVIFLPDSIGGLEDDWFAKTSEGRTVTTKGEQGPLRATRNLSCYTYRENGIIYQGVQGTANGGATTGICTVEWPIACSALVAVPVRP